jgi:hypothetical protein
MSIEKYGKFWAVYENEALICVTVYKKGALEVMRRLRKEVIKSES